MDYLTNVTAAHFWLMSTHVWIRTGVNDATKDAKKDTVRHTSSLTTHRAECQ